MAFQTILDFIIPIIAFLLVRENLDAVLTVLRVGSSWTDRIHSKIHLFHTHDLVRFFRRTRFGVLISEVVCLLIAVFLLVKAKGYCGPMEISRWISLLFLPPLATMVYGFGRICYDRKVRSAPFFLAEFRTAPDQEPVDLDDPQAVEERTQEVDAMLSEYGPRDRSPLPHMWAMIYSPLVLAICLALVTAWMGYYSTFRLNGLERHWAMLMGLDSYLALALSGFGYKFVVGAARAIILRLNDALAPAATAVVRTLATALPTIEASNVDQRVPAITGQFLRDLAKLTEDAENLPIAKLQLIFAVNMVLPNPYVLMGAIVFSLVVKADYGNQEAEGLTVTTQRQDDARRLSPWLKRMGYLALTALYVCAISRGTFVTVLLSFAGVINPFLALGVPTREHPEFYHWILPILGALLVATTFFALSVPERLPNVLRRISFSFGAFVVVVLVMNLMRGARYQISENKLIAAVACPADLPEIQRELAAEEAATPPSSTPPAPPPPEVRTVFVQTPPPVVVGIGSPSAQRRPSRRRHGHHDGNVVYAADVESDRRHVPNAVPCSMVDSDLRDSMRSWGGCY